MPRKVNPDEVKMGPEELRELFAREERLEKALTVMVLDARIAAWLHAHDPQALKQARTALDLPPLADVAPVLDWWIVTVRRHGDDEDSLYIVQAATDADAMRAARVELADESGVEDYDPDADYEADEERLFYVNHVVRCGVVQPSHEHAPQ